MLITMEYLITGSKCTTTVSEIIIQKIIGWNSVLRKNLSRDELIVLLAANLITQ